ncbi:Uncharacterised protein [Mycobacteroides abscessus subsp. massiliense]|nr:Uncharacterised protein [Mycobacteroides abscessus subsp. massiliense]
MLVVDIRDQRPVRRILDPVAFRIQELDGFHTRLANHLMHCPYLTVTAEVCLASQCIR